MTSVEPPPGQQSDHAKGSASEGDANKNSDRTLQELEQACQRWQSLAEARERELGEIRLMLREVYRSRSWRLTKPLRQLSLMRQQWQRTRTRPQESPHF